MPVVITHESELGKELAKWEMHRTHYVGPEQQPGNPFQRRDYPMMLYKAVTNDHGKIVCGEIAPLFATDMQISRADMLTKQCQRIVGDEAQHRLASGQGWCGSPQDAIEQAEREAQAVGNAAAEAAYQAQRMTDTARREYEQADRATGKHVVDVQPKRNKRGRPAKGTVPVIGTGPVEA